ncbi:hypothetical protein Pfo_000564 [Paulownia fortunei]|nr:hypothetical protein Pfo_000564 [Paulownia fortunei]
MNIINAPICSSGADCMIMHMIRTETNNGRWLSTCPRGINQPKCFLWVDTYIEMYHGHDSVNHTSDSMLHQDRIRMVHQLVDHLLLTLLMSEVCIVAIGSQILQTWFHKQ